MFIIDFFDKIVNECFYIVLLLLKFPSYDVKNINTPFVSMS